MVGGTSFIRICLGGTQRGGGGERRARKICFLTHRIFRLIFHFREKTATDYMHACELSSV